MTGRLGGAGSCGIKYLTLAGSTFCYTSLGETTCILKYSIVNSFQILPVANHVKGYFLHWVFMNGLGLLRVQRTPAFILNGCKQLGCGGKGVSLVETWPRVLLYRLGILVLIIS